MIMVGLLFVVAFVLRVAPHMLAPQGLGVDQWFWRAYIDRLRLVREFPPRLPQFLLDEAQWYPPLFPVLMARLPQSVFDRHAHWLAVGIDLARMALLVLTMQWLAGETAALVAGVVYALTPLLVTYNLQLNPRGLGALFLDALCLLAAWLVLGGGSPWLILPIALLGGLILLTHKMTTQVFVFVVLGASLLSADARFLLLCLAATLAALVLSAGFYRYVAIAHWDILRFWHRNWRWLGANPIHESPVYGSADHESPTRYYRKGWRGLARRLQFVAGFNPWVWSALLLAVAYWPAAGAAQALMTWTFAWLALILAFALLTTIVPAMRCMGNGYLYGYNASFPAAMVLGLSAVEAGGAPLWWGGAALTLSACLAALGAFFRAMSRSRTLKIDSSLDQAIQRLAELPRGVVMCLPVQWNDVVAYRANQPVLFGGHGYGFRHLQSVFPRLLLSVPELMRRYRLRYVLSCEGYLNAAFVSDLPVLSVECFGANVLYVLRDEEEVASE